MGGSEVTRTDRAQSDAGKPLPPLQFIKACVKGCLHGDAKEDVQKALGAPAAKSGGGDVHGQLPSSPYEMLLVLYGNGKVSRILAVHRAKPSGKESDVPAVVGQVWGRDIDNLGFIRRQEGERGQIAGSYFWHDDRTRVETSVQNTDQGARLMTDWRVWPLVDGKPVAKRPK